MRMLAFLIVLGFCTESSSAEEPLAIDTWVFPGAQLKERSSTPVTVTSADKRSVQSIANGSFQYVTEKPFHEVVLFYARKSGLNPTNKSILAREFPGTKVYMPAHFASSNFYREAPSVTALHYIREDVASAQLLVTDHPDLGFLSVSVTRSKSDDQTVIQLIHHTAERILRNAKPSDPQKDQTQRIDNGNSIPSPR